MHMLFLFFVFLAGNVNAVNNNLSLCDWKKDKIINLVFSYFKIQSVYDGWVGFKEIKEGILPITVYLKNNTQAECQYDTKNDELSRFDPTSGKFYKIFNKYKTYSYNHQIKTL